MDFMFRESGIPAFVRLAERKEHGIAYGYRDEDYFFSLIQFIFIPYVRSRLHKKT